MAFDVSGHPIVRSISKGRDVLLGDWATEQQGGVPFRLMLRKSSISLASTEATSEKE